MWLDEVTDDIGRILGRIEGKQDQVMAEVRQLRADFGEHKQDDQRSFSSLRTTLKGQFDESIRDRNQHLNEQDVRLETQDGRLKIIEGLTKFNQGAGWVIIALIGFLGACVVAALSGVKFH